MEKRNVLLSVKDLVVKFRVRGRILTAIRGISLDIYENESIAIVGESGSGKSVFTKTFAGMLDENGFIDNGKIIFDDAELADTKVKKDFIGKMILSTAKSRLDRDSKLEFGAAKNKEIIELTAQRKAAGFLSDEEAQKFDDAIADLMYKKTEVFNHKQTLDSKKEKDLIRKDSEKISEYEAKIKQAEKDKAARIKEHKAKLKSDVAMKHKFDTQIAALRSERLKAIQAPISKETEARNDIIAKEILLSVGRYGFFKKIQLTYKLLNALKKAMSLGVNLKNEDEINAVFDDIAFRVKFLDETDEILHGTCVLNLANIKYSKDWSKIRGRRIATVFQDPMTSLNPIITIGKQITSIILKHQNCSQVEARERALTLMKKVGIPNAEKRFDDYPFQYSGGMRQRIVIAIALSCQPKILICDEPTTALDVTIQAQILRLLKDLQKEFNYTIVFITHDLGVVANIADRVAVLYAGQIVELGTVDEVFYDPRHPYTWALLSSLPQLAERNTKLYSIFGTPPSLYNKIIGDPFAPRNPYCLKIDTLKEAPMFKVTDTHYAKTWLLDPRSPKLEKPEIIRDIHSRLMKAFNI